MNSTPWISAHLFYHADREPAILGWVRPVVAELTERGLLRCAFFIRYWQGGPHIRLRLQPRSPADGPLVRACLEQQARRFLAEQPSAHTLQPEQFGALSAALSHFEYGDDRRIQLYPDNSLHYIPYEPDLARYGGAAAMEAVERHFSDSSAIVCELLAKSGGQVAGRAALTMQLLAMGVCVQDLARLAQVFERSHQLWLRSFSPDEALVARQIAAQFARHSQQARQVIGVLVRSVQRPGSVRLDPLSARWRESIAALHRQLCALEGRRELASGLMPGAGEGRLLDPPAAIILDCVHMHNNRLGLSFAEEAYQAYVLARLLDEIAAPASAAALP